MAESSDPFLTLAVEPNGGIVVKAGGTWSIHGVPPGSEEALSRLETCRPGAVVSLDFTGLREWDSSLVSLVATIVKRCRDRGLPLPPRGVPDGLKQLAAMALAVPERIDRRTPQRESFLTRLGKAGLTLGASVREVFALPRGCQHDVGAAALGEESGHQNGHHTS